MRCENMPHLGMEPTEYLYTFTMPDQSVLEFSVDTNVVGPPKVSEPPEWTRLDHHKCSSCPLDSTPGARCPAALAMVEIIRSFAHIASVTLVDTSVSSSRRVISRTGDVQTGLRSLMGLVMPMSGCPILGRLRSMAHFHLPFADRDETVFRVVSAHLFEQYLRASQGEPADWDLTAIRVLYRELQEVNISFARRTRPAAQADASVNALVALFSLATLVSMSMDDDLLRVRDRVFTR